MEEFDEELALALEEVNGEMTMFPERARRMRAPLVSSRATTSSRLRTQSRGIRGDSSRERRCSTTFVAGVTGLSWLSISRPGPGSATLLE